MPIHLIPAANSHEEPFHLSQGLYGSARERFIGKPKKEKGRQLHGGIAVLDQVVVEGRAPSDELHEVFVSDLILIRDIGSRDNQTALGIARRPLRAPTLKEGVFMHFIQFMVH
jgi:hypothetical protein